MDIIRRTGFIVAACASFAYSAVLAAPTDLYLDFDKIDDGSTDFVELSSSNVQFDNGAFTLSAWINPASWGDMNQGRIIDHVGGTWRAKGWTFQLENDAGAGSPQALRMLINNDGSFNGTSDAGVISLNSWQHVAATLDNGTLSFFVNGQPAGVRTGVPAPRGTSMPVHIGRTATGSTRGFDGGIDEVRMWNRSLSQAEIQSLMNVELTGTEPGLMSYFPFNDGAGQIATDFSPSGIHGQLGASSGVDSNDPVWATDNSAPDTEQPQVSITAPLAGATVAGAQIVSATATDNVSVSSVTFAVDGSPVGTDNSAPFSINWDTTTVANGVYTVSATATDPSANAGLDSIAITVDNGVPVNQPPVVDAGNNATIRLPVNTVNLDGTVTDDGLSGTAVTTLWSGPPGVTFDNATAIDTGATFASDGSYLLTLTANDGEFAPFANVTVTVQAAPALASIAITPAALTIVPGGSEMFAASGTDQYGDPIASSPQWSATGGTIDGNGLFVAGATQGAFAVTASDSAISAQAPVTISDAIAPTSNYLAFDALDDGSTDFVELSSSNVQFDNGAFTLSAWINPASWGDMNQGRIIDHVGGTWRAKGWTFQLENDAGAGSPQALRMLINNDGSFNGTSDAGVISLNSWQHVAATLDNGTLSFFVNGQPAGVRTGVPAPRGTSMPVHIGRTATGSTRGFDGGIDEVRMWNRSLSQAEIQSLMNVELTGTEPGLMSYFPFNDGAGQIATDFSPSGIHGQLGASSGVDSNDPVWATDNSAPDTEQPQVSITAPLAGATVAGAQIVSATATDNVSVSSVTFAVDGSPVGTDNSAPFSINWDTTTVANGVYTVSATATDPSANAGLDSIAITVDNGVPVNQPPVVDAGNNATIRLPVNTVNLDGTVTDDGLSGTAVTTLWSGPPGVTFDNATAIDTGATFASDGSYLLTLTANDGEFAPFANVTVTVQAAPALASIAITPAALTIVPGGSEMFAASGTDQYGDPIASSPQWSATGGTIDGNGLFVAGATQGAFAVTASDSAISAQAPVTISDAIAPTSNYLAFDALDDGSTDFVELSSSNVQFDNGAFTLSAWINPASWGDMNQGRIIDHVGGTWRAKGWTFQLENDAGAGSPQALRMLINNDGSFNGTSDAGVISLNSWQHVAATLDNGTLSFFVNGQPAGVRTGVPAPRGTSMPVHIGRTATGSTRGFDGGIDEVRMWNRSLSQAEIQSLMNVELTGTEPGLMSYFPFNDGAGQIATDFSPSGIHGQLGASSGVDSNDPVWATDNSAPDTEQPQVSITAPLAGATVAGAQIVSATATDNVSVSSVTFAVDGSPVGTDNSAPFSINWDTTTVANGVYTVSATATDPSANAGLDSIAITVDNGVPVNQPPVVDAGNNATIRLPVNTVNLDGTVTDDGLSGTAVTTLWSGPPGVTFDNATAIDTGATFASDGSYLLTLTANDGEFAPFANVTITVEAAPVATVLNVLPSSTSVAPGATVQFSTTGTDQYGEPIATSPQWSATGGVIDNNGLYTAGQTLGNYAVTAHYAALVQQADVAVSDVPGPTDIYLNFDASADGSSDYVEIPATGGLQLDSGAFTLSAWINPANWGGSDQGRILDHGGGNGTLNKGWSFHLENKASNGAPRALRMQINASGAFNGQSDANVITLNSWQHVAATLANGTLSFFVNGQPAGVRTGVPTPIGTSSAVRMGTRIDSTVREFSGAIDEVRVWGRSLSQAEIQAMMHQTLAGTEPGLVAYYPLDKGFGQIAKDFSPNGHDGQLGSSPNPDANDPAWGSEQAINAPPNVNAGPPQGIVLPVNSVQLNGAVNDDGLSGVSVTTRWTQTSGPAGVVFANNRLLDTTATFPGEGTFVLTLTADDGEYLVGDTTTVTVTPEPDVNPPVITLAGANPQLIELGHPYVELGATALDDRDGDISGNIVIDASAVNPGAAGNYLVTYDVSDAFGNPAAQVQRTVTITPDVTAPEISLLGANPQFVELGNPYVEAGATAFDLADGDLTGSLVIDASAVMPGVVGTYQVTYNVTDEAGNTATEVVRDVTITPDETPPAITLLGSDPQVLLVNTPYVEAGATAQDLVDGDVTASIVVDASAVDTNVIGEYPVTYNVMDNVGNAALEVSRTVKVEPLAGPYQASDNSDTSVVFTGTWTQDLNYTTQYGVDYAVAPAGMGTDTATFTIDIPVGGNYQVAAWFTANTTRGTDVPYDIYNNGLYLDTVLVNQKPVSESGQFNTLGTYLMNAGTVEVVLSSTASGTVSADAVGVCLDNACPSQQISSPAWDELSIDPSVTFTVDTDNYPPGWGVEFVLNGDDANATFVANAPFTHTVNGLMQGDYVMESFAVDENSIRRDDFFDLIPFAVGDVYIGFGDSITRGSGDKTSSDDTSMDGRNTGGGYTPILNDNLTAARNYPHSILNAGVSGDATDDGLARLPGVLANTLESQFVLVLFGTNDARTDGRLSGVGLMPGDLNYAGSFKHNMQQMISLILGNGKIPVLAKPPIIKPLTDPVNVLVQEYGDVIDELVFNNSLQVAPPDFFTYFENNQDQYTDSLHPNGLGYQAMAQMWADAMLLAFPPPP